MFKVYGLALVTANRIPPTAHRTPQTFHLYPFTFNLYPFISTVIIFLYCLIMKHYLSSLVSKIEQMQVLMK